MTQRARWLWLAIALALAVALAACGNNEDGGSTPTPEPVSGAQTPQLNLNTGPGLALGGASGEGSESEPGMAGRLPGCSDAGAEDCPAPVSLPLDAETSADGITIGYLSRYFDVAADAPEGVAIRIVPNAKFPFADNQATFDVYRAETVESAVAAITATDTGAWTSAQGWEGTIAVEKDEVQDPQTNTSIGAFALPDGGAIALKAVTTGRYGWDLWSVIYEQMLDSLVVEGQGASGG